MVLKTEDGSEKQLVQVFADNKKMGRRLAAIELLQLHRLEEETGIDRVLSKYL